MYNLLIKLFYKDTTVPGTLSALWFRKPPRLAGLLNMPQFGANNMRVTEDP
jgi:hypothetical protein